MYLFYLEHHFLFGIRCINSTLLRLTGESCGTSEALTITVLDLVEGLGVVFGRSFTQVVGGNRDSFTIRR